MDLHKIAVKIFAEDPRAMRSEELIPVFHRWIQKHTVEGTLIDVADYSHVPGGPGVVLVGFEADFALDETEGPLGLLVTRKQPLPGEFPERVAWALKAALDASAKLEAEPELKGRLRFKKSEALFLSNDRLLAPNSDAAFEALKAGLETAGRGVFPKGVSVLREGGDPRRRLAVRLVGSP